MMSERHERLALSYLYPGPAVVRDVHVRGATAVINDLKDPRLLVDTDEVLERMAAIEARFVVPGDVAWPSSLEDLPVEQRPLGLWVRGARDVRLSLARSVAIVGSRASTAYGERVALAMAGDIADAGWAVVSGGAMGIDAAAHRGARAVDGVTVAVMACGIDMFYPRTHDALFTSILEAGAIVTEVPPGQPPARFRFLERNRLIAALSAGTVVVEASLRSGALSTLSKAHALGRHVMGVPGPVNSAASAGVHRALQDGATLVTCAADVIDIVGALDPSRGIADGPRDVRDLLSPRARTVLDAFTPRGESTLDELDGRTGLGVLAVSAAVGELESRKLLARSSGGWRLAPTSKGATAR